MCLQASYPIKTSPNPPPPPPAPQTCDWCVLLQAVQLMQWLAAISAGPAWILMFWGGCVQVRLPSLRPGDALLLHCSLPYLQLVLHCLRLRSGRCIEARC